MSDWRLQGQEAFLRGAALRRVEYKPYRTGWDHDHCEFCGSKFSRDLDDLHEGYVTEDNYHWICDGCYQDFRVQFGWRVIRDL